MNDVILQTLLNLIQYYMFLVVGKLKVNELGTVSVLTLSDLRFFDNIFRKNRRKKNQIRELRFSLAQMDVLFLVVYLV